MNDYEKRNAKLDISSLVVIIDPVEPIIFAISLN